jgi:hypothetical protein
VLVETVLVETVLVETVLVVGVNWDEPEVVVAGGSGDLSLQADASITTATSTAHPRWPRVMRWTVDGAT